MCLGQATGGNALHNLILGKRMLGPGGHSPHMFTLSTYTDKAISRTVQPSWWLSSRDPDIVAAWQRRTATFNQPNISRSIR
jgi:hypothetical protein